MIVVLAVGYATVGPAPLEGDELRIAGVQPGVIEDSEVRFATGERLTRSLAGEPLDLVVWGESSVGFDPESRPGELDRLADVAGDVGAPVLVNIDRRPAEGGVFKTSVLVGPEGAIARYDKTRLVPFGEYIPLRHLLGWITGLTTAAAEDRHRGERLEVLTAPGTPELRLGPLICFESAFPDLARRHAEAGIDVVVLQTATTTVEGTWAQAQHASLAAIRAVETGRPVVHAALSGVSGGVRRQRRTARLVRGRRRLHRRTASGHRHHAVRPLRRLGAVRLAPRPGRAPPSGPPAAGSSSARLRIDRLYLDRRREHRDRRNPYVIPIDSARAPPARSGHGRPDRPPPQPAPPGG